METSELSLEELRKEIFDLDELYTEFAKLKREKALQDQKYRGALNAVLTARGNLSSAEQVIDRYKRSVVTTEDHEAVLAQVEEARTKCKSLEDDYNNLVNSSAIKYQKTCNDYMDKIAALELERNLLQDEDNQPQLQRKRQTPNKKGVNGKLQFAYDDSVREVEVLKTKLKELRSELECMRLKNDSADVSLKDKYEKEIYDLKEQNLKQRDLSVREVEVLKTKLKELRSELECMRLKNDSADVSLKDKYEKDDTDGENDESFVVDAAISSTNYILMLSPIPPSPIPPSPSCSKEDVENDVEVLSTPKLQSSNKKRVQRSVLSSSDKELLEIVSCNDASLQTQLSSPTQKSQPVENIIIRRKKMSMHTQTDNGIVKKYMTASTQTEIGRKTNSLSRVANTGKITKVKTMKHFQTLNYGVELVIQIPDHAVLKQGVVIKLRTCEGSDTIRSMEGDDMESEVMEPISISNKEIVKPRNDETDDTDGENDESFVVDNHIKKFVCSHDDVVQNNGKRRIAHEAKHGKKSKLSNSDSQMHSSYEDSSELSDQVPKYQRTIALPNMNETPNQIWASTGSPSQISGEQPESTGHKRKAPSATIEDSLAPMSCRTTSLPDITGRNLSPRYSRRISEPNTPQKLPKNPSVNKVKSASHHNVNNLVVKIADTLKAAENQKPRCSRRISGGPPEGNSSKQNRKIKLQSPSSLRLQRGSTRITDEEPDNKLTIDQVLDRQKAAEKLAASITSKGTERKSFKRPLCKKRSLHLKSPASSETNTEVVGVLAPKAIPIGKVPAVAESRPNVVQLQIIPEVEQMSVDQGKRLLEEMLQCNEEQNIRTVTRSFMGQKPEFVVKLVLQRAMIDPRTELVKRKATSEPVLTVTQDALLKLMVALEKLGGEDVCNTFLDVAEDHLPTLTNPMSLWPITRLYVAICKLKVDIWRIRKMLCNSFASMSDLAIPFIYIMLQSWLEVMPSKQSLLHESLFGKAVMQLVLLKSCTGPDYNLFNLRQLLMYHYGYPSDMHDSKKLLLELFNSYIEDGNECYETLALAFSQTVDKNWVFDQIETTIKPKAQETNNVNQLCSIVKLVASVTKFHSKTLNASVTENNRQWLKRVCCEGTFPYRVREGAVSALSRLSKRV